LIHAYSLFDAVDFSTLPDCLDDAFDDAAMLFFFNARRLPLFILFFC